jgi:hypothetical protein
MMTNGPSHEAGETARSLINIFGAQPLVLALVVMNFALLGFLYWASISFANERQKSLEMLYADRQNESKLLAGCYPTPAVPPTP